jgi:putative flippase GtrA
MGVEWLDADPVLASVCGFAISAVFGYVMSHRYTFASAVPHRLAVMRFCAVVGVGLLLNALLMQLLYRYLHWHYLLAQVLTTGGTMLWHFIAHRWWTFEAAESTGR